MRSKLTSSRSWWHSNGPSTSKTTQLLSTHDLKLACSKCAVKEGDVTYRLTSVQHQCARDLLICKAKAGSKWRPVSRRPKFPIPFRYEVCWYFVEGSGCTKHKNRCTYATSDEEAAVWNFEKSQGLDHVSICKLLTQGNGGPARLNRAEFEYILQEFSGEFLELCGDCFISRQQISVKKWNGMCSADAAHAWSPILVHHLSESHGKEIYNEVRPLPANCRLEFCSHVQEGKPCWHQAGQCQAAHSEMEMAVWRAEDGGLSVRPDLLKLSGRQQTEPRQVTFYCRACLLHLTSPESFYNHCASREHAKIIADDTSIRWRLRPPPHNHRAQFWMCDRPKTCEYGVSCVKAHSEEELKEWLMRAEEEEEIRHSVEARGLMSYSESLLEQYRHCSSEVHIMAEQVDDVSVTCNQELCVHRQETTATLSWDFQVNTERQLVHVALLKQEPGASFSLGPVHPEPCSYSSGERFWTSDSTYGVTVSFESANPGLYEQWLVLDFDMRPVLLRRLKVRVGPRSADDAEEPAASFGGPSQSAERWHRGNCLIIPCQSRREEEEELLKEYKPPQVNFLYKPTSSRPTPLSPHNYKERMHNFLYDEEQAEDQVVSRLNVCGEVSMSATLETKFGTVTVAHGELVGSVSIPYSLTPDTPEGFALRRSIQSALIAPASSDDQNTKVYEAEILQDTTSEKKIHLRLSRRCCSDLALRSDEVRQMEVQFQLNRHKFCTMHKAVDLLPDTHQVLPDLENCAVPAQEVRHDKLNAKQQLAVAFVTGEADGKKAVAPLLIYGPFGTGKTFTLATAAIELTKTPRNKVLICTHTNSSADLYVRDHFHPLIRNGHNGIKPLRIKATTHGTLTFTDEVTMRYCLYSSEEQRFLPPTKADLDVHKVVITTTTMARHLHDLKLPVGYFTHILIDEASQMLECEALMALGLAGPDTRVILAGDHMQMGPKLFSVDDHQRSNHTLLTRLFHYYLGQTFTAAQKSRVILHENYRSTKEIVEFVSTHFYVGSNAAIKAVGNVMAHPDGHALRFHHVRGECRLDTASMSWFNSDEAAKVAEVVQDILQNWPQAWGSKNQASICVLSEGCQVGKIRASLSRKNLSQISVESFATVQGKQFRAVIITAVQTRESLKSAHLHGLELFDDARVFNTAMTRAQSQVVVVGDAAALCCFGKCSRIWKSYIDHCISNGSVKPKHFTTDFFESDVKEIARFQKSEPVEESAVHNDEILQQLKDESEKLEAEYNSDNDSEKSDSSMDHTPSFSKADVERDNLLELNRTQPNAFKQGQLVMETYDTGYVIPSDNPTKRIYLKRRKSFGRAFNGDKVLVQTSISEDSSQDKVVGIIERAESSCVFVCIEFVRKIMIPITKSAPKIAILLSKKNHCFLPVWDHTDGYWKITAYEKLSETLRQNHVFMVQVITWKEGCLFPLGKVVDILPIGNSVQDGLRILNEEFKVTPAARKANISCPDKSERNRKDLCDVITFTIDPGNAKDLDDAISVRDAGDHFELGIHIADVVSFVNPGDTLDKAAKKRGSSYYAPKKQPVHMFPVDLSTELFSLMPHRERKVVSLMLEVTKETNQITGKPTFQLSRIKSNRKLSYEEAEEMICKGYGQNSRFDTVEGCVAVAYCFAKVQRKARLGDCAWAYDRPDEDRLPGKRKAHQMIEELSVLFNTRVSQFLISSQKTMDCTPLRCQAAPDPEKIDELKKTYGEFIPLSFHMRCKVKHDKQNPTSKTFSILTKVWNDIQAAAKAGNDIDKIVDLVATDDIHPQLLPAVTQYRKSFGRAYVIRSNSCAKAKIGHYSLHLKSYTQASSPIRRYMDIVLQRLLHNVICDTSVHYSPKEIDILCNQFEQIGKVAKEYEQIAEMLTYAVSMKKQNALKLAFIVSAEPERESFRVSLPFNKNVFPDSIPVMYRDLQLEDQPLYDETSKCMTLTWKRRVYSASTMQIHDEVTRPLDCGPCTELPLTTWQAIIKAIDQENWDDVKAIIKSADTKQLRKTKVLVPGAVTDTRSSEEKHYVDLEVQLRPGDTLQIQMSSELRRGYLTPAVQLLCIKPKFEVCVDHVHNPIPCFSKCADDPPKTRYRDCDEYVRIWKPLCEMESAATAVDDSNSIVIEDMVVNFLHKQDRVMTGSFNLPLSYIEKWAIECNLAHCFLCIRKRNVKLSSALDHSAEVDPSSFIWVAHGVTTKVEPKKSPPNEEKQVEFNVSHLPMDNIPECIFQKDTRFTVEIIPKLLPDIRKEYAVNNIVSANKLVQKIALGHHIPREGTPVDLATCFRSWIFHAMRLLIALCSTGTGKTVVGVNMVYWFCEMNSRYRRRDLDAKDENKKEVILYCGPSNKSVDVVAEYLLKFGNNLKPLRVYSQQVELLDYPYPNCNVQFSTRSLRQEDITLHHRMREEQNPNSAAIRAFDLRRAGSYRKLLSSARKFELERHDIILCTCTVSSTPSLIKTVLARQILIDECAMATEPQALIPLVCNKPEKIVLIGDHKQLRPIVKNEHVRRLGMAKSLFERYFTVYKTRAVMLDTQYRMHEDICKFPSEAYYDDRLKTEVERPNSVLLINNKPKQIIFGDVRGKEISQVVSTEKGHENSKANPQERDIVVDLAKRLVENSRVQQQDIVILSPYNAQVAEIRAHLRGINMDKITVTTITKSQGSEWRYVLISTVRSLPNEEIDPEPDRAWLTKHVGFVGDPNQINVGITRAKEGLCIIGNQQLLSCSAAWRLLFSHYNSKGAVTEAERISVRRVAR
uniref:RNB domain-containing protein n=1 Tax=Myripristis murdjan TaxID=586833 RepID=A0A667XTW8_9TELE